MLACFETAFFAGFVRQGGIAAAIAEAGLAGQRSTLPLPGLFALYRATPRVGGSH